MTFAMVNLHSYDSIFVSVDRAPALGSPGDYWFSSAGLGCGGVTTKSSLFGSAHPKREMIGFDEVGEVATCHLFVYS